MVLHTFTDFMDSQNCLIITIQNQTQATKLERVPTPEVTQNGELLVKAVHVAHSV